MVGGEEVGSAYVSIGVQLDESTMSAAKSKFSSAVSDMSSGIGGLRSSLGSELSASMSGIASSMGPVGGALSAIGPAGMVAGAGIAVVGSALSSSVTTAAGFQQQMAGVAAIMGSSGAELQAMSSAAREAGASTQFSASQAAEALSYMAGAGWDSQQATAGLKDTLTMAAAGGMDLASAGDLMTNTIAQFNLEATNSGQVANTLAAGAAETNTNIAQLGGGLKEVGSTAAAFGMSLESTTAALGALSNAGIKGAEGGTALRGILAGLASQSGPAAEALAELGISAEQINPATVSVADAMELLNEKGMTATQAFKIFGRENVSAAIYLAAHASSLDELETSITGTSKATEMAAIQTDTYLGAQGEFSSAVEEAQIAVGTLLLPTLTDLTKVMTGVVNGTVETGGFISDFATGVSDSISTAFSGGSLADVDEAFLSAMGVDTGKEAGDQLAEGIAESDNLKEAPGEALSSPEAKAAVTKSSEELAKDAVAAWKENFVGEIFGEKGNLDDKIKGQVEIGGGLFTALEYDINNEFGNYKLRTPTGDITYSSLSDMKANLAKDVAEYVGRELSDVESAQILGDTQTEIRLKAAAIVDTYLDFSDSMKDQIKGAGKEIAAAYADGMVPDVAAIDARLDELRKLKLYDPEEARWQGTTNAINYLEALKDAIESSEKAKADILLEPDNEKNRIALDRAMDNLQKILDANPLVARVDVLGEGIFETSAEESLKNIGTSIGKVNTNLQESVNATQAATVGYNQLQKAIEDCEACVMSDFGAWQEQQENLFNPSYIGAGGQAYLDWKNTVVSAANEAAMAVQSVGGAALGSAATPKSIPVSVALDTSKATAALTEFEGAAKKDVQKPLDIDSSKATASLSEIDSTAKQTATKPLSIDSSQAMSAIAAINSAASAPVYKTVYVNEVYTGSSGGGGGGGGGNGYLGDYMLPPIFMARGGYVSRPTLAVVGEAGPEYVIPAENMAKGLSRMGGGGDVNVTINSPIMGGGQDIEALLAQRNKELVAEITEQIAAARRGL